MASTSGAASVSFGDELPVSSQTNLNSPRSKLTLLLYPTPGQDQFAVITESVSAHIALAHDAAAFLADRAALEREYSTKLQALTSKLGERRQKRLQACTVGNDPSKTWSVDVANRSTLQGYVSSLVSTSESAAGDHASLADALDRVAGEVNGVGRKGEDIRKKHNAFYEKVVAEREKVYGDRMKVKGKYDEHCHEADAQRQKKEKAGGDKATKAHAEAQAEMWNAKVSGRE